MIHVPGKIFDPGGRLSEIQDRFVVRPVSYVALILLERSWPIGWSMSLITNKIRGMAFAEVNKGIRKLKSSPRRAACLLICGLDSIRSALSTDRYDRRCLGKLERTNDIMGRREVVGQLW